MLNEQLQQHKNQQFQASTKAHIQSACLIMNSKEANNF